MSGPKFVIQIQKSQDKCQSIKPLKTPSSFHESELALLGHQKLIINTSYKYDCWYRWCRNQKFAATTSSSKERLCKYKKRREIWICSSPPQTRFEIYILDFAETYFDSKCVLILVLLCFWNGSKTLNLKYFVLSFLLKLALLG